MAASSAPAPAPTIGAGIVYERLRPIDALPSDLRLRNLEWGVLFALDGRQTVAEVSARFGLDPARCQAAFATLEQHGLIAERALTRDEYVRAMATVPDDDDAPKTRAAFLQQGLAAGAAPAADPPAADDPPPAEDPPSADPPAAVDDLDDVAPDGQTRAVPVVPVGFQPLDAPAEAPSANDTHELIIEPQEGDAVAMASRSTAIPTVPPAPAPPEDAAPEPRPEDVAPSRRLSLKALMQAIMDRAPDLTVGQLDIYRVFIKVNTALLRRNGITTLRFADDRLVTDPELQQAITSSLESTLGMRCPRHVFV
ncbi:MAG: helix-turn-helix domain-containing protein [Acidobacteriota bacterium]